MYSNKDIVDFNIDVGRCDSQMVFLLQIQCLFHVQRCWIVELEDTNTGIQWSQIKVS